MELITDVQIELPDQAIQAWTNGYSSIEKMELSNEERLLIQAENSNQLQGILVERFVAYSWSARAIHNAIEERYPFISEDEGQQQMRKRLMKILHLAMDDVEIQRVEERKRKGVALI